MSVLGFLRDEAPGWLSGGRGAGEGGGDDVGGTAFGSRSGKSQSGQRMQKENPACAERAW